MNTTAIPFTHVIANSTEVDYVPFAAPAVGGAPGETAPFGEISVLREAAYNGNVHVVAFWKVGPATSPLYDVPLGDESGYVIEGSATIELIDSGKSVELKAGDLYSFAKGTLTRWTIHEPFKKFVVVTDGPAHAE